MAGGILALPFVDQKVNIPWLLNFLLKVDRTEFDTFFQDIRVLAPGHFLTVDNSGTVMERYWELTMPEQRKMNDEQACIAECKRLFERAVSTRSRSVYPVGAELSGGLDSSSIVAIAQKNMLNKPENLHIFARVLPAGYTGQGNKTEQDETPEIEKVCQFLGIRELHRVTMEHQRITQNIDHVLNILRMPCFSNYPAYNLNMILEAQNAGVRTILSGHGGDQMVTNPAFFVYPDYRKNREFMTLYRDIRAKGLPNELPVLQSLKYLLGIRYKTGNQQEKRSRMDKFERMGINEKLTEWFSLREMYRQNRQEAIFAPTGAGDLILRIQARHMNNRVESTALVAAHSGIEFRYPMFDVDLILFYLSLPDGMKFKHRISRYIHRMAMQGELPEEIRMRKDKRGSINPGLSLLFANDAGFIRNSLHNALSTNDFLTGYLFNQKTVSSILKKEAINIAEYKSLINKYFQLTHYRKKIEEIFG
jgi:asparagine synthase (glutamine-hydrolysing)